MLARTIAAAVQGIDAIRVEIEVTVDFGAGFMVIGLPDTAVKESAERVRCAVKQAGHKFPGKKVMVNMSPADIKKEVKHSQTRQRTEHSVQLLLTTAA